LSSLSLTLSHALGAALADEPSGGVAQVHDFERAADDRLIDRTLAGQSAAYGDLVGRYQDRLRASLLRLTGSAEEAEDVAQEAFVQAYLKLTSFQRSSRFYTWVYRIAFNLAVSKSRKRRPRLSLSAVEESGGIDPVCDAPSPGEPLLAGERSALLHAAIAELEEEHRQVIVLREFDGLDYQQIADLIGAPIGTVRSRLFRARAQLRQRLAAVLGEDELEAEPGN
jgi:RNA polymerase sigma-70 factor (ECF subfamily)